MLGFSRWVAGGEAGVAAWEELWADVLQNSAVSQHKINPAGLPSPGVLLGELIPVLYWQQPSAGTGALPTHWAMQVCDSIRGGSVLAGMDVGPVAEETAGGVFKYSSDGLVIESGSICALKGGLLAFLE